MEATVVHHLKQAQNFKPFLHIEGPNAGKAIINMPYWIKLKDSWWFDFIRKDMDKETFKKNLDAGAVYYLKEVTEK